MSAVVVYAGKACGREQASAWLRQVRCSVNYHKLGLDDIQVGLPWVTKASNVSHVDLPIHPVTCLATNDVIINAFLQTQSKECSKRATGNQSNI